MALTAARAKKLERSMSDHAKTPRNPPSLIGKCALVTGAARGIGARMLLHQLEMGHDATAVVIPAAKVQVRHLA